MKINGESFESSFDKHGLELEQFIPLAWAGQKLKVHAYRVKPSDKVKVDSVVVPFASYDGFHLKWINNQGKEEKSWEATGNLPKGSWMALPEALEQLQAQENKVNRIPIMPFKNVTDEKAGVAYNILGDGSGFGKAGLDVGEKIAEVIQFLKGKMGKDGVGIRSVGANQGATGNYSIFNAVNYIDEKALSASTGKCAYFVRMAIMAGGIDITPHPVSAKDYGPFLIKHRFKKIVKGEESPIKGDISVLQSYDEKSVHGHIAIFNGSKWVSDFVQRDIWAGPVYRENKPTIEIYRWEK